MSKYAAFTKKEKALVGRLITNASVASEGNKVDAVAQWDTGASGTCISKEVATALSLTPIGRKDVMTPTGGDVLATYMVDIALPNNVVVKDVVVMESQIGNQGIGVLVGMDIISMGDFAVTTSGGTTTFSFVTPSMKEIDFVPKAKTLNQANQSHRKKQR